MTTQQEIPEGWQGTPTAFIVFKALVNAGKLPGKDFTYSPRTQGSRIPQGVEADFVFTNPPNLAMQVHESIYEHHTGTEIRGTDIMARAQLAGQGISLVFLDHALLLHDPEWLIKEALQYRDHSRG